MHQSAYTKHLAANTGLRAWGGRERHKLHHPAKIADSLTAGCQDGLRSRLEWGRQASPKPEHLHAPGVFRAEDEGMGLFGAIVKLAITPIAVVKDVVSLGGSIDNNGESHTLEHLEEVIEESNR